MPRKNRRNPEFFQAPEAPPARADAPLWAQVPGFDVRHVGGQKEYRCPGCDHIVREGIWHLVVVPEGDADARRHWHTECWRGSSSASADIAHPNGRCDPARGLPCRHGDRADPRDCRRDGRARRYPGERVEAPALRPVRNAHGARARPLPLPRLPLHPALLRLVARPDRVPRTASYAPPIIRVRWPITSVLACGRREVVGTPTSWTPRRSSR